MKIFVTNTRACVERVIKSLVLYGALSIRVYVSDPDTACVEIGRGDLLFSFSSAEEADSFAKDVREFNPGLSVEGGKGVGEDGYVVRVREDSGAPEVGGEKFYTGIAKTLSDFLDVSRSGKACTDPKLTKRFNDAVAYLTKKIEETRNVSEALKFVVVDVLDKSLKGIADGLGFDESTLSKYVSGARTPSLNAVIAVCLAVCLPPQVTHAILKKTHYGFVAGGRRDTALMSLVDHCWTIGNVEKINGILIKQGLKPLTKKTSD